MRKYILINKISKMKSTILTLLIAVILFSCNNNSTKDITMENKNTTLETAGFSLIGKKGIITFPEMKANVTYTSDSMLHWKTTDNKAVVAAGDEKISYKRLSDNLHFLNWIEKDGWTVSQIIDTKSGTVKAFWSFEDDKSTRGKRSSMFVDAKFEFDK